MTERPDDTRIHDWLAEAVGPTPDPVEGARQVMSQVEETSQVGRWLPFPVPRRVRSSRTPSTNDTQQYQPSPIPATNGHTPTVSGRTSPMLSPVQAITAGALVFAIGGVLLIAQPFEREPATGPEAAAQAVAMLPAMVTGTINHHYEAGESTGRVETNDHRLNGDVTSEGGYENFPDVMLPEQVDLDAGRARHYEAGGAELAWGSLRITNDDGSWDGHVTCTPTLHTNGFEDPCFIELSGSGGYDGLSALLVTRDRISAVGYEPRDETYVLDGLIFPGNLPPDR